MTKLFRETLQALRSDTHGAAAPLIGLMALVLVGAMGMSVDTARGYLIKSKLSSAIDAAALAGGRDIESAGIEDKIRRYFDANFPEGYLGAEITSFDVTFGDRRETVTIQAEVELPTAFMGVFGRETMQVGVSNRARRHARGLELALVMDNTGSMSWSEMKAMKNATQELVGILYGDDDAAPRLWISLVPYTATVNIGTDHASWVTGISGKDWWTTDWKGCVEARPAPYDETDDTPVTSAFDPFYFTSTRPRFLAVREASIAAGSDGRVGDNDWGPESWNSSSSNGNGMGKSNGNKLPDELAGDWSIDPAQASGNSGVGPNLGCGPAITPLTASRTRVENSIDEMDSWSRGGTMANLGLVWGWRTLSPKWRGLWSGSDPKLPLDYGTRYMDKAVVILTDGENQWYDWPDGLPGRPDAGSYPDADYNAYGRLSEGRIGTTDNGTANVELDRRMTATCEAIKAAEIEVYAVTFKVTDPNVKNLFQSCASSPENYWNSPANSDLSAAFREIGSKLSNLRLER